MKYFANLVFKHKKLVIFLTIAITAVLGFFIKNLQVDPDMLNYLPQTDPAVELSTYISEEYGGNLLAMVAVETENLFSPDTLRQLAQLTENLGEVEGVASATSITNIVDIREEDGWLEIGSLIDIDDLTQSKEAIQKLKDYIMSKDMYKGKLLSADGTTALVVCQIEEGIDKVKIAKTIKEWGEKLPIDANLYYGGQPFYLLEISNTIVKDLITLVPLVSLLIIAVLYLSFRTLWGVLLPLLSVLISIVWTLGIMSIAKIPLSIISDVIPVILIAVGSAYSIHMLNKFYEINSSVSHPQKAKEALKKIGLPIILAAITTVAGFISFIFGSYLTMIQQFGFFTSLGVFFALLISITLVPVLLSMTKSKAARSGKKVGSAPFFAGLADWINRTKHWIVGGSILIIIIALLGIPRIERKVDILDYFKPESSIRQTEEKILNKKFGGSIPLQILIRGDIQNPAVLNDIKQVQDYVRSLQHVNNPFSVVDIIMELNEAMGDGRRIPESQEKIANLWFFIDGQDIVEQMVNQDKTEALIQATTVYAQMDEITDLVDKIDDFIAELDSQVCTFAQTGMHAIYKNLDQSLMKSQFQSLFISLGLILVIVSLLLGSLLGGIIGLVPIIFTLIIIFGFMGYVGIPLDIATVLVASISVGIGIDYAIHFISRFRNELSSNQDRLAALKETLTTSGKGILINMLTVTGGFLVFLLADLVPLQRFGASVALTMLSSGFASLLVLPAITLLLKKDNKFFNSAKKINNKIKID